MRFGIMGTGVVGQTLAAKLVELGHQVMIGTRDAAETRARTGPGRYGEPPLGDWLRQNPEVQLGSFAQAAAFGDVIVNATAGVGSLDALRAAGAADLEGKVLIDVSNPLDFSKGMPPSLSVSNTDSLGEQIQRAFPGARVVKTLNTVNAAVMVDPRRVAGGDHHVFVSGDDAAAKAQVAGILQDGFGWRRVIDLGGIATARVVEMYLPLWITLLNVLQTPAFNVKVVT
jgi:hypothetical protein